MVIPEDIPVMLRFFHFLYIYNLFAFFTHLFDEVILYYYHNSLKLMLISLVKIYIKFYQLIFHAYHMIPVLLLNQL